MVTIFNNETQIGALELEAANLEQERKILWAKFTHRFTEYTTKAA